MEDIVLEDISQEIEDIFYPYVKIRSDTFTKHENDVSKFLMNFFGDIDYFKENPHHYGLFPIEDDALKRSVSWALIKGEGEDTVVLIHHNDTVGIEDFKGFKSYAYEPKKLEKELINYRENLSRKAEEDLLSGNYIFGRGTADMKAGGSIQLALLKRYSTVENFKGNVLVLSVPDEENLSAGMRSAVLLLDKLRKDYNLDYKLMINSEPHQRVQKDVGILSEGSVGKIMPFVYVRGLLSHAGKVFEGLNPVNILSEIVRKTELNVELLDFIDGEASPPPTWLYLRDRKEHYDVSMPLSVGGCFSILTFNKEPNEIMKKVKEISLDAFNNVIEGMNESFRFYQDKRNKKYKFLPWKSKVVTFNELHEEAYENYGVDFLKEYKKVLNKIINQIKTNEISMIEGNLDLVDTIFEYIKDLSPRVVIGLVPPYYPNVSNIYFDGLDDELKNISRDIMRCAKKEFNQEYVREYFYTGISDLSYSSIKNSKVIEKSLLNSMALFNELYTLPLEEVENNSMPCINVGPWGKDFHKLTERVLKEDLFVRTPKLLNYTISRVLGW
ncbi:M20/M25/M40 family metallo-hydrolase [Clostridium sp. D2Q-14]|uniref:M20/M25/M40 family metallo-hydrolase n=1 Tax=Anaeromonas gelatinilytica TaxID=2683194 RepID=UPI00193C4C3D|nr:M20/M25/M40 family metallo-hydrolase [Anaeromonas gelatinilytica]MBS4535005.1 M20/M25/M40 family metallo-hydrolase [Anaeromonas gelatinilytica]